MPNRRTFLPCAALLLLGGWAALSAGPPPDIAIKTIPPAGKGGETATEQIAGIVTGTYPEGARVVIYAFAADVWWVQPTVAEPYTQIGKDRKWSADTHLGQNYAAVLVSWRYTAQPKLASLPAVGNDVLAVTRVKGR